MGGSRRFLELLELSEIALLFLNFHTISWRQLTFVFLLQPVDGSRLIRLRSGQLQLIVHAALFLHEVHHVLLDEGHAQDFEDLRALLIIFHEHLGYKVL